MPRCLVPELPETPAVLTLTSADAHHLRSVLRVRVGDRVQLLDGAGRVGEAQIEAVSRDGVRAAMLGPPRDVPPLRPRLTLLQCVLKPSRMDWLIEKSVELGVARIVPVLSHHAVVRPGVGTVVDRWTRIADSALMQCGNPWRMRIEPVTDWASALGALATPPGAIWCAALSEDASPLSFALRRALCEPPEALVWCVGPEGDFTEPEREDLRALGAEMLHLGHTILRAETAAIAGLGTLRLALSDAQDLNAGIDHDPV